nr:Aspartate homoserine dehydrogenase and Aspartate dehydrogenase domain containing protein [Haemonchus contortus]
MHVKRVGIIGYGHLGEFLVNELNRLDEFEVVRIWNRTPNAAKNVLPLEEIVDDQLRDIDLVVEVAHPAIIREYAAVILANCDLFIGSPTCLADAELYRTIQLMAAAKYRRVLVPAGAFWGGNDIQKMADQQILKALTITMTKHPSSFKLESPLKELNEAAKMETEKATVLYEGPVRGLCPLAPNNVNTMAGGAIAAHNLGFDGVTARLVSDPKWILCDDYSEESCKTWRSDWTAHLLLVSVQHQRIDPQTAGNPYLLTVRRCLNAVH